MRRLTDDTTTGTFVSDRDPDWSPTRTRVVSMRHDGVTPMVLTIRRPVGTMVSTVPVEGTEPVWMNGRRVLCGLMGVDAGGERNRTDIAAVSVPGGAVRQVTNDSAAPYEDGISDGSPAFSPDGRWLAWCRGGLDW